MLIDHLMRRINQEYGRAVQRVAPTALRRLVRYRWPGNIRELENVLRRAIINLSVYESVISDVHLPDLSSEPEPTVGADSREPTEQEVAPLAEVVAQVERVHIERALRACAANRTRTAALLGVSLRTLHYKLKQHRLTRS